MDDLNIDMDDSDIEVDDDDISVMPEPNYAVVTDIEYSADDSRRMNLTDRFYAVSIPCIEPQIVDDIRTRMMGKESVLEVDNLDEHVIVRYESTSMSYLEVAHRLVSEMRSIRNQRSISDEYQGQNGPIKDHVGNKQEDLRYIY